MKQVKAAVAHEFGAPLSIETVNLRAPMGREIEVSLEACAICHSDIAFLDGNWGGVLPAIYGHEAAGRITSVGPDVKGFSIGDTVIVTLIRACGSCASCASGRPVSCGSNAETPPVLTTSSGSEITQAMYCGAFAEKVVVDQSQLAPIAPDMPMDVASLLSCGVITGVGAVVNTAQVRPGQTVIVIGAGGVGLNTIQGARIAGAARIIAIDLVKEKLQAAKEFGATDTVLASAPDVAGEVSGITRGHMADAIFVTVGAVKAYDHAVDLLATGGRIIMVGMPPSGAFARYEPANLAAVGQGMIGSKMGDVVLSRDIPWMVDLYQQGRLKLDELISRRWRLEEINDAIADTKSGAARRNVILFS